MELGSAQDHDLAVVRASHSLRHHGEAPSSLPAVRRIEVADLRDVLAKGLDDFAAYRTDVIFICIIYPLAGLVLARLAAGYDMLPLVFPLASGFALLGPIAAVGLYEMSRRREQGADITWADAFGVVRAPAFGAIVALGLILLAIFLFWLAAAYGDLRGHTRPGAAGLGRLVRARRVHDRRGLGDDRGGQRGRLPVRRAGADDQRGVVPAAARPGRRALHRGGDLDPRGGQEPGPDGGVGADRRGRVGARVAARAARPDRRHARARARHLAPLPQAGAALTCGAEVEMLD